MSTVDRVLPWAVALAAGLGILLIGASRAYFPQTDVYSYYQLFHYLYSSVVFSGEIPLWQPYASYGLPSAFELAFTFGPSKALSVLIGLSLGIRDVQALYFLGVGIDFALLSLAAAWIVREIVPQSRPAMIYAALAMPALHLAEWQPNFGYGFAEPMLFVVLFTIRFFRSFQVAWLSTAILVLVGFTYGSPQYFLIIEAYTAALFFLACAARHWRALTGGGLGLAATSLRRPLWLLPLLPALGLGAALWRIDHSVVDTLFMVVPGRDPETLKVPLDIYLTWGGLAPPLKLADILLGRIMNTDAQFYIGLTGLALAIYAALYCNRRPYVLPLLLCGVILILFAMPEIVSVSTFVYHFVPGMDRYRHVQFSLIFCKPFFVILAAVALADVIHNASLSKRAVASLFTIAGALVAVAYAWNVWMPASRSAVDWSESAWIAIGSGGLFMFGVANLVPSAFSGERGVHRLIGVSVIVSMSLIEPVVHRAITDEAMFESIAAMSKMTQAQHSVDDGYRYPRQLEYRPVRQDIIVPSPPFRPKSILYHGYWSLAGLDPCTPKTRSDTYAKGVAEALRRTGVTVPGLSYGRFAFPNARTAQAFGCGAPKLTVEGTDASLKVLAFSPNRLLVRISADGPGTLVYRDAYDPSWKVLVDGMVVAVQQTDFGFKSVRVPTGSHEILWSFEPEIGQTTLTLVGLTLAGVPLVLLQMGWIRAKTNGSLLIGRLMRA